AQQGAVTGAAVAVSAPMGGTQMMDWQFWKKKAAAQPASGGSAAPAAPAKLSLPKLGASPSPAAPATSTPPAAPAPAPKTAAPAAPAKLKLPKIGSASAKAPAQQAPAAPAPAAPAPAGPSRTERFKNAMQGAGKSTMRGLRWAWDKTGGRLGRWNDEAVEEYTQAQDSQTWDKLSRTQKAKWIARNPLAWMRSQNKGQREKAKERMKLYEGDTQFVADYLNDPKNKSANPSSFIDGTDDRGVPDTTIEDIQDAGDKAGTALEVGEGLSKKVDKLRGRDGSGLTTALGHAGATLGVGMNVLGAIKSGVDAHEERQQGNTRGFRQGIYETASNAIEFGGNVASFVGTGGAEIAGGVLGAASGVVSTISGLDQGISGTKQKIQSERVKKAMLQGKERKDLSQDELLLHDTASQAAMVGTENAIRGYGGAISGMIDTAAGVLDATGVGAAAGTALSAANLAVKGATALAGTVQHNRIKSKVSEQTISLNDDMIKKLMEQRGLEDTPQNRRRMKRAALRSHGYKTGYREELLRDQTTKRSSKLAELANQAAQKEEKDRTLSERMALKMMGALGVKKADGGYNAEAISKNLGNEDGFDAAAKLRKKTFSIESMAQANAEKAQKKQNQAASRAAVLAMASGQQPASQPAPQPAPQTRHTPPNKPLPPLPTAPAAVKHTPPSKPLPPPPAPAAGAAAPKHTPPSKPLPPLPDPKKKKLP
ncbi:MAG: hypothetical protein ACOYI3_05330, partial [Christensenellales bacterium]